MTSITFTEFISHYRFLSRLPQPEGHHLMIEKKTTSQKFYLKIYEYQSVEQFKQFMNQIRINHELECLPNKLPLISYFMDPWHASEAKISCGLIFQHLPTNLEQQILERRQTGKFYPKNEIKRMAYEIILFLAELWLKNIVHGNIRTCNIWLQKGRLKLGNFGQTPQAPALEENKRKGLGRKQDIYSFGLVLMQMCTLVEFRDTNSGLKLVYKLYGRVIYEIIADFLSHSSQKQLNFESLIAKYCVKSSPYFLITSPDSHELLANKQTKQQIRIDKTIPIAQVEKAKTKKQIRDLQTHYLNELPTPQFQELFDLQEGLVGMNSVQTKKGLRLIYAYSYFRLALFLENKKLFIISKQAITCVAHSLQNDELLIGTQNGKLYSQKISDICGKMQADPSVATSIQKLNNLVWDCEDRLPITCIQTKSSGYMVACQNSIIFLEREKEYLFLKHIFKVERLQNEQQTQDYQITKIMADGQGYLCLLNNKNYLFIYSCLRKSIVWGQMLKQQVLGCCPFAPNAIFVLKNGTMRTLANQIHTPFNQRISYSCCQVFSIQKQLKVLIVNVDGILIFQDKYLFNTQMNDCRFVKNCGKEGIVVGGASGKVKLFSWPIV